jgi:hypothetical protein
MQKVGRNDPCPCGSGKKFKKCCEEKMIRKKFSAELISGGEEGVTNKAQKISTNFFQKVVQPSLKPPSESPESNQETNLNS